MSPDYSEHHLAYFFAGRAYQPLEICGIDKTYYIDSDYLMAGGNNRYTTFALANRTGGLSGPAIHPVAVRMVWQCAQAVKIPIIGMGGVRTAEDALELIMAGASAVSVGTANFHDQTTVLRVIDGIEQYLIENNIADIRELIGCVK